MHSRIDLNLLIALDALLEEGSVGGAADRLHLSGPAMSRTLGRIRKALGDPVLVRSGRAMVPTPRALAVRAEVHELVERARSLFTASEVDMSTLTGSFTVQADEGVVVVLRGPLLGRIARETPGLTVRFLGEGPLDTYALRRATVDLEIGVIDGSAPETRLEPLLTDRFIAVVRPGHPLLDGEMTPERFAAAEQIVSSRRGRVHGPIDDLLAERGLRRRVVGSVPTVPAGLLLLLNSDLVGFCAERMHRPLIRSLGLAGFPVPLDLPPIQLSLAWHPRYDADPAHAWLRHHIRQSLADLDP